MVGVQTVAGRPWAKVERNPSRWRDPDGCSVLPVRDLPAALCVMFAAAGEMVTPAVGVGLSDANTKRVDVARDFRGVTSPGMYVDGLRGIQRPYAKRNGVWASAAHGNAQTLMVGNGQGMVRPYDQHAAYADKGAPVGAVRWEAELRTGWLESVGVKHVSDLDAVSVANMATKWWEWSKMGVRVSGPVHAVELLRQKVQAEEISVRMAKSLLGSMVWDSFDTAGIKSSRQTQHTYRKIAEELGLSAAALWSDDLSRQASGRLDFQTGTEFLELTS